MPPQPAIHHQSAQASRHAPTPSATSDIVVIGGGPAGSTFAAITRKYAPNARVTVLEKARFPRWHIGESTIPVANGVLEELEVFDQLSASGAIKKIGITFVWGRDRRPWNADYLLLGQRDAPRPQDVVDVVGQDFAGLRRPEQDAPFTSFNVLRAEFDHMLLNQARAFGAHVFEGTRVSAVQPRPDGAGHVVTWQDEHGRSGHIETGFVMDASGLSALMTRGHRQRDPHMSNFAVFGYLSGARWKVTYNGRRSHTTVFIASIDHGWIWYFPVADDVMSVGVVTHRDHFRRHFRPSPAAQASTAGDLGDPGGPGDGDLETFFWQSLRNCEEIAGMVEGAHLRDDILPPHADGTPERVRACQDWSSWATSPVGAGFATAGDAAMFVDPILSSGVTLALQSGHRAAYTWLTARTRPELDSRQLWQAYADYLRGEAGSFLQLARFFYGNNRAAESWWWEAHRIVNGAGRLDLADVMGAPETRPQSSSADAPPHGLGHASTKNPTAGAGDSAKYAFTMATAGFFPVPRAIPVEIIGHLIAGTIGEGFVGHEAAPALADELAAIYERPGLPTADALARSRIEPITDFHLALRTEPPPRHAPSGQLEVYHDLVTDDDAFFHRLAVAPTRISPALAPVVTAIPQHHRVSDLMAAAPALLPPGIAPAATISHLAGQIVRVAALKGFIRLEPDGPDGGADSNP